MVVGQNYKETQTIDTERGQINQNVCSSSLKRQVDIELQMKAYGVTYNSYRRRALCGDCCWARGWCRVDNRIIVR